VGSSSIDPSSVNAAPGTDAKTASQSAASPGSKSPNAPSVSEPGHPTLAVRQSGILDIHLPSPKKRDKSHYVKSKTGSSGPETSDTKARRPLRTARRIASSRSSRPGKTQGTTPSRATRAIHDRPKAHVDPKSGSHRALAEMKERSAQAGEPAEGDIEGSSLPCGPHRIVCAA
jgi:hypothetical protein